MKPVKVVLAILCIIALIIISFDFAWNIKAPRSPKTECENEYRPAAEQGDMKAQYHLGYCYYKDKNHEQAFHWIRKAAEQGHSAAQFSVGYCYFHGEGVNKNRELAVFWYRKAADQEDIGAQYNLGYCYQIGEGVTQNMEQSVYWYRKAAEQGLAMAQNALGLCYHYGDGVSQNREQAEYWFRKAAEQGHEQAKDFLRNNYQPIANLQEQVSETDNRKDIQDFRAFLREGNRQYEAAKHKEAETSYRRALHIDEKSNPATFNLGNTMYRQNKYEEAGMAFERASSRMTGKMDKARAYHNLGNSYLQQQKLLKSIEAYKQALRNNPDDADTKYNLSYALNLLKQSEPEKKEEEEDEETDKIVEQAIQLVAQRKYQEAYDLMKDNEKKYAGLSKYADFTERILNIIKLN